MTKDFNQPRRDDHFQPSSRYTSSENTREERPFKPARPRLSRDTVDRAWENGANPQHADYHPRQNMPRPPFQQQGRPGPATGRPQQPSNRPGYGTRPENYRGSSSPSNPGYQRREQGPESSRRPLNGPDYRGSSPNYQRREQRPEDNRRPFNGSSSYRGSTSNSGYQRREQRPEDNRRPFNGPSGYRGPASNPGYQRRDQDAEGDRRPFNEKEYRRFSETPNPGFQRNEPGPESNQQRFSGPTNRAPAPAPDSIQGERWTHEQRGPSQPYRDDKRRYQDAPPRFQANGPARNDYRSERGPRPFERSDRERPTFIPRNRPGAPQSQRDNHNPRWQSRPAAQRDYRSAPRDGVDAQRGQPYGQPTPEHFEGDYERFDARHGMPSTEQAEYGEKHVTSLPDGRVLKGSRPAQRKQARFWNEVAEETSTLMDHAPTASVQSESVDTAAVEKPARPRARATAKPKVVRTVKMTHSRGTGGMKSVHGSKAKSLKRKMQGPQGPGTRPSKRGYKWPTPGE
ncbi:MAG: hypothetical protein ACRDHZ_15665 [Ktedonobacteraceae bacterium]